LNCKEFFDEQEETEAYKKELIRKKRFEKLQSEMKLNGYQEKI